MLISELEIMLNESPQNTKCTHTHTEACAFLIFFTTSYMYTYTKKVFVLHCLTQYYKLHLWLMAVNLKPNRKTLGSSNTLHRWWVNTVCKEQKTSSDRLVRQMWTVMQDDFTKGALCSLLISTITNGINAPTKQHWFPSLIIMNLPWREEPVITAMACIACGIVCLAAFTDQCFCCKEQFLFQCT